MATVHSWAGAILFLLVFLVSFTGALAAFAGDMFRWQSGALFAAGQPAAGTFAQPPARLIEAASLGYPQPFKPVGVVAPNSRFFVDIPVVIGIAMSDEGQPRQIFLALDPYTAAFKGEVDMEGSWTNYVVHLHESLLLGEGGSTTVAVVGIVMILFTLTGLYQWWPRFGRAWIKACDFRLRGNAYSKLFKVHGLGGLWLAPLVLLWCFTGSYISQPAWFANVFQPQSLELTEDERTFVSESECGIESVSLDQAFELAQERAAGQRLTLAMLPTQANTPYRFWFQADDAFDKHSGDTSVYVSSVCRDSVITKSVANPSVAEAIGSMMFSLHTGRTFGPFRIVLVLLTGLTLSAMSVAGLYVWWKKTFRKKQG